MKLKKTQLPKNKKITFLAVLVIVVLLVLLTFMNRLVQKEGFAFSCADGNFSGLHFTPPPPMCFACFPDCFGHIETYVDSRLICNSTRGVFGASNVVVDCDGIKEFIGKNATVHYWINSSDNSFEGKTVVLIEYKK